MLKGIFGSYSTEDVSLCQEWIKDVKEELQKKATLLSEKFSFDFDTGLPITHVNATFIWEKRHPQSDNLKDSVSN